MAEAGFEPGTSEVERFRVGCGWPPLLLLMAPLGKRDIGASPVPVIYGGGVPSALLTYREVLRPTDEGSC